MGITLFIAVFLLKGLWETEAFSVTGVVGEKVKITCNHQNAYSNIKYFCKGGCNYDDVLITSKDKDSNNRKYCIENKGNTFYVLIRDLTKDDSGTYWCGIDRVGVDTYNKVELTVKEGGAGNSNSSTELSSNHLVYIGVGLGVVVLTLAMVLVIFFRHRNRKIRASSGKDHDMSYATVQKQHARRDITAASANEETGDGLNRGGHREDIHTSATVSPEHQSQPDGLFYSTVSFSKHKGCNALTPLTTTATYSAIKHVSSDESTVYSNV